MFINIKLDNKYSNVQSNKRFLKKPVFKIEKFISRIFNNKKNESNFNIVENSCNA